MKTVIQNDTPRDFCSYKISMMMRDRGFNEACLGKYSISSGEFSLSDGSFIYNSAYASFAAAPTKYTACMWMTEKFGIYIDINKCMYGLMVEIRSGNEMNTYTLHIYKGGHEIEIKKEHLYFSSYDEALDFALEYSLATLIHPKGTFEKVRAWLKKNVTAVGDSLVRSDMTGITKGDIMYWLDNALDPEGEDDYDMVEHKECMREGCLNRITEKITEKVDTDITRSCGVPDTGISLTDGGGGDGISIVEWKGMKTLESPCYNCCMFDSRTSKCIRPEGMICDMHREGYGFYEKIPSDPATVDEARRRCGQTVTYTEKEGFVMTETVPKKGDYIMNIMTGKIYHIADVIDGTYIDDEGRPVSLELMHASIVTGLKEPLR